MTASNPANQVGNPAAAIPVYVVGAGAASGAAPFTGTKTTTTAAVQLSAQAVTSGVFFTAPSTNAAAIEIGPVGLTTANGYRLAPGATSPSIPLSNLNQFYLIGANTSDVLTWVGI